VGIGVDADLKGLLNETQELTSCGSGRFLDMQTAKQVVAEQQIGIQAEVIN